MKKLLNAIYVSMLLGAMLITNSATAQTYKPMSESSAPQAVIEGVFGGKLLKLPVYACGTITSGVVVPCSTGGGGSGGDATAAKQTTGNASLASIQTNTTTLLTRTLGGQFAIIKGTIPNAATQSAGQGIGGLITIATGQNSTTFSSWVLKVKVRNADATTLPGLICWMWDSNPTASTFVDGSVPVVGTADINKMVISVNFSFTAGVLPGGVALASMVGTRSTSDSSGNLYLSCAVNSASSLIASSLRYEFNGQF